MLGPSPGADPRWFCGGFAVVCGPAGTRTLRTRIKSPLLYLMSYRPRDEFTDLSQDRQVPLQLVWAYVYLVVVPFAFLVADEPFEGVLS